MSALGGKYELAEKIGGGGMADVYRGRIRGAEGFSRPIAIKKIKRSVSSDPAFAKLFVEEARVAAALSHPNIVQTIDFDRDAQGCFYLVMELIEGVDLRKLAQAGPISPEVCVFVVSEILRALDYVHELVNDGRSLTIVHRDISPHNIMLGWQGAAKVVDFGIAKAVEGSLVSRSGSLKGKVAYMSPEQVHGQVLDGRSDLFAVGIILHEILTGNRLFVAQSEAATLSLLLSQPIPRPSQVRSSLPPELDAIVMKLLERDREHRYLRARDVLDDLLNTSAASPRGKMLLEDLLAKRFSDQFPQRVPRFSSDSSASLPAHSVSAKEASSPSSVSSTLAGAATLPARPSSKEETPTNRFEQTIAPKPPLALRPTEPAQAVASPLSPMPRPTETAQPVVRPDNLGPRPTETAQPVVRPDNLGPRPTETAQPVVRPEDHSPDRFKTTVATQSSLPNSAHQSSPQDCENLSQDRSKPWLLWGVLAGILLIAGSTSLWLIGRNATSEKEKGVELVSSTPAMSANPTSPQNELGAVTGQPPSPPQSQVSDQSSGTIRSDTLPSDQAARRSATFTDVAQSSDTQEQDSHSAAIQSKSDEDEPKISHRATAELTIRVKPWALVFIDGKSYGQTPKSIPLRQGKHRITLRNEGLAKEEKLSISLKAHEKKKLSLDWR